MILKNCFLGSKACVLVGDYNFEMKSYYQALGYRAVVDNENYLVMSDNSINILLDKTKSIFNKRYSLIYFTSQLKDNANYLTRKSISYNNLRIFNSKAIKITNLDRLDIYLVEQQILNYPWPELTMLNELNPQRPEHYPTNCCGLFGELSLAVKDLKSSLEFWQKINFKVVVNAVEDYPWGIVTDGKTIIGLHQTTNFNQPTITYFAYNMGERIKKLQKEQQVKLRKLEGSTSMDKSAVTIAPNGLEYFLFTISF